jgi:threo-3-hydroxy-L-aspartate ammonia-lyase
MTLAICYEDILGAADRLATHAHRTPVLTSTLLNQRTGAQVFLKCENFQKTGSFKFRGAYNALTTLDASQRGGVISYSSGNHAQALALAGQQLGIPVTIVMPSDAPAVKRAATEGYGATVVIYDRATQVREAVAAEILSERPLTLIPPFNFAPVMAGQGTAALELIEEVGALDLLLVPCGGGGLLSGCAIATRHLWPKCQIIGVEPKLADDATRSFNTRTLQRVENSTTVADGVRTPCLGDLTFPIILDQVDAMVTVSDAAIVRTMCYLWERLKIVVEPTGALALAPLLEGIVAMPGARVGVILSGGNVDLTRASRLFAQLKPKVDKTPKRPLTWELS